MKGRKELSRRLRWVQSDLSEIEMSRVIEIEATEEGPEVFVNLD